MFIIPAPRRLRQKNLHNKLETSQGKRTSKGIGTSTSPQKKQSKMSNFEYFVLGPRQCLNIWFEKGMDDQTRLLVAEPSGHGLLALGCIQITLA